MDKTIIRLQDYAGYIINALGKNGVLLTTAADGKVNSMTIGWGTLGINWSTPVFTVYVRKSRFTKELLDKNPEFTINVPAKDPVKKILALCGTKSGRDVDKIKEAGLTLVEPERVNVPGIKELPLTIECRVIYRQEQDIAFLDEELSEKCYPLIETPDGPVRDTHITYYGEIQTAYVITDSDPEEAE